MTENKTNYSNTGHDLDWPPGLCGEIAQYIYRSSHRPVREVSIVAALGLLAGICGKAWQTPTDTGLNLYIILVARSAIGKEAMHTGISQLMSYVRQGEPSLEKASHFVNFNDFASGQALQKAIVDHQSFVNVAGEFGLRLQQISNSSARPDSPMQNLRRIMTNLYSKSGKTSVAAGINYSDKEKNIGSVHGAAYSLVGETTPSTFYGLLNSDMMSDGFLSRFSIVEYLGDRPPENQMASKLAIPAPELLNLLRHLIRQVLSLIAQNKCTIVQYDSEADQMLKWFNEESDNAIRAAGDDESKRQTWNRAHLKVLKIASIFAVADNPMNPIIATPHVQWAMNFVLQDIQAFMKRLESGDIGTGDEVREQKVLSIIKEYLVEEHLLHYARCFEPLRKNGIIPRKYLQQRTQKIACFSGHRLGATKALNETILSLIDAGHLMENNKHKILGKYDYGGKSYLLLSTEEFKLKKNEPLFWKEGN